MADGYGTNYVETEALLAVQSDEPASARRILDEMLDGELVVLADAATNLAALAHEVLDRRNIHRAVATSDGRPEETVARLDVAIAALGGDPS